MARETMTPGSRTIQTYRTPTGGSNEVEVAVRATTNGLTTDSGFQIGARDSASANPWLRLTRTNNTFTAYHGSNGLDWTVSGVTTQAFIGTLNIGAEARRKTASVTMMPPYTKARSIDKVRSDCSGVLVVSICSRIA